LLISLQQICGINNPFFIFCFAVNANECLMTRMQEMSLDYHFTVEQEVGSSTYAFFGFNGNNHLEEIVSLPKI